MSVKNIKTTQKRGCFLVVEGGEGVGKSTNMAFIKEYLRAQSIDFVHTREPGGTPLAEDVRALLLQTRDEPMSAMAELLLVFAARAQHVEHVILPALNKGQWVLSDRFVDASYVYQGVARDLGDEAVGILEKLVLKDLKADAVIILDAALEVSQARAASRGELDRFEQESTVFHQTVREAYLSRAAQDPQRYCVINAAQSLEAVQGDLKSLLIQKIHEHTAL